MTPSDPKSDFLEAALRQSRSAVADAGFSLEVERRLLLWRRRRRFARWLPVVMAIVGIGVAASFGGLGVPAFSFSAPEVPNLASFSNAFAPILALLSSFGIRPWMICAGFLVLFIMLLENRRDQRLALRF